MEAEAKACEISAGDCRERVSENKTVFCVVRRSKLLVLPWEEAGRKTQKWRDRATTPPAYSYPIINSKFS